MARICIYLVLGMVLLAPQIHATLTISNTLGDNMVLQRAPAQANIWGWANASDSVNVVFNNQNLATTADANGNWIVQLPATDAGGPYTIAISTGAGDKASIANILFGEVWLCGGQSNMQFTVDCGFNASEEVAAADDYPDIRVFSVGQGTYSADPQSQLQTIAMPWSVASSATIGNGNWTEFSAVCWFTGRYLYDQYKVPFGLISSNWGGTYVQAWSSPSALTKCNQTYQYGTGNNANSVLYNAMINPFLNTALAGVLWYQGEQNQGDPQNYTCMFPEMITSWREAFATDFTFLFVQLSTPVSPVMRQAQLAALPLPKVGFATAADLGDNLSPFGSIHPRDKQDVGRRLTLAARNIAYGEVDVVWEGPMFQSATQSTSGSTATVAVTWELFGTGSFVTKEAECPAGVSASDCLEWEVGFSDGSYVSATSAGAQIQENLVTIQVTVPSGASVTSVSYGWSAWPIMTLYSEQDLPAIPFYYTF